MCNGSQESRIKKNQVDRKGVTIYEEKEDVPVARLYSPNKVYQYIICEICLNKMKTLLSSDEKK